MTGNRTPRYGHGIKVAVRPTKRNGWGVNEKIGTLWGSNDKDFLTKSMVVEVIVDRLSWLIPLRGLRVVQEAPT